MNYLHVSIIAGGGVPGSADGIGTAATFTQPGPISYSESHGLVMIDAHSVRRVYPGLSDAQRKALRSTIDATLVDSGRLTVEPTVTDIGICRTQ